MRIVAFLPVLAALASAAEYSAADPPPPPPPPSYAPGKPPIPPLPAPLLLLIAKLLEASKLDDYSPPAPYAVGDGVLPDPSYAEPPLDLLSLLKLLVPKYAPKAALKIPGLYANVPPYALPPALLNAAYGKPAPLGLGLLPPYAPPPLNYVYPPGLPALPAHPPALPPYPPPLPKLPLGYPGYAPPALNLPPLPLLVITKEELESLKLPYGAAPVEEVLPPADYIPKPKKLVLKKAPVYAPLKVPAKPALVKAYAAPAKIKPAVKVVKTYTKLIKPDLPVVAPIPAIPAIPAGYAVEDVVAAPIAPAYAAVAAEAPVDLSPAVEARSASGNEPQHSTIAGVAKKAESTLPSSTDGGESARALPSEPSTSPQKTISRIS